MARWVFPSQLLYRRHYSYSNCSGLNSLTPFTLHAVARGCALSLKAALPLCAVMCMSHSCTLPQCAVLPQTDATRLRAQPGSVLANLHSDYELQCVLYNIIGRQV